MLKNTPEERFLMYSSEFIFLSRSKNFPKEKKNCFSNKSFVSALKRSKMAFLDASQQGGQSNVSCYMFTQRNNSPWDWSHMDQIAV